MLGLFTLFIVLNLGLNEGIYLVDEVVENRVAIFLHFINDYLIVPTSSDDILIQSYQHLLLLMTILL